MRTYEVTLGSGSRSQAVRVQADNIVKAKNLFEMQYGKGCTAGRNIREIKDTGPGSANKGGCLTIVIAMLGVLMLIGYLFAG